MSKGVIADGEDECTYGEGGNWKILLRAAKEQSSYRPKAEKMCGWVEQEGSMLYLFEVV